MNTEVLFENKDNKLIVTLNKNSNYADIKSKLISILDASPDMFNGIEGTGIIIYLCQKDKHVCSYRKAKKAWSCHNWWYF